MRHNRKDYRGLRQEGLPPPRQAQPATPEKLLADNFEFEMIWPPAGHFADSRQGQFIANMPKTLKAMFPTASISSSAPHVAARAVSDIVAGNGRKYADRYHFHFIFDGGRIALAPEYNDVNHMREVFFA